MTTTIPRRTIHFPPGTLASALEAATASPSEQGALLAAFEDALTRHLGGGHAIPVGSGRLGLRLLLTELGLGAPESRVALPAFTDESVPEAIRKAGGTPVFVDVARDTMNLSTPPEGVHAVLATHLFGAPCDLPALKAHCAARGQILLEDCAHAIDARVGEQRAGTFGAASFFSFVVTKAVNTFGGGAIWTADKALATRLRARVEALPPPSPGALLRRVGAGLALHQLTRTRVFSRLGPALLGASDRLGGAVAAYDRTLRPATVNANVDTAFSATQAAVGLVQLRQLAQTQARRREIAQRLVAALPPGLEAQRTLPNSTHALYFLVVRCEDRDAVVRRLRGLGVDVGVRPMRNVGGQAFPNAQWLEEHTLQLPIHPELDEAAVSHLERALRRL